MIVRLCNNENNIQNLEEAKIIDNIKKSIDDYFDLKDQWSEVKKTFVKKEWTSNFVNDDKKYEQLKADYEILCADDVKYSTYKKAFNRIANTVGLKPEEIIIDNITFSTYKGMNRINVRYSKGLRKIKIPKDLHLLHISPVENITDLNPSFRSKTKGKYLYPDSRCYFTIGTKKIRANQAGLEGNSKLFRYQPTQDYIEAWIDPDCSSFSQKAVYIKTETPIKVKSLDQKSLKEEVLSDDIVSEDTLSEEYANDVVLQELFVDPETKELLKKWKTSNQIHLRNRFLSNTITDEEYMDLKAIFKDLHEAEEYTVYKKAFDKLCKYAHISPDGTIITGHKLTKGKQPDKNTLYVGYNYNNKPITLPNDISLYHTSTVSGIKELKPFFRGKPPMGYLYDKPRIYLTMRKTLPRIALDFYNTKERQIYEVQGNFRGKVYVDPLIYDTFNRCIYVVTNTPIKVTQIETGGKPIKNKDEEKNMNEAVYLNPEKKSKALELEEEYDKKFNGFCLAISTFSKAKVENTLDRKTDELNTAKEELRKAPREDKIALRIKIDYLNNVCNKCKSRLKTLEFQEKMNQRKK